MSYDLYVDRPQGDEATKLRLLVTKEGENALKEYLLLVHGQYNKKQKQLTPGDFNSLISRQLKNLSALGINPAVAPKMDLLPPGSWFLQFTFTLAKPWISKDDDPFYVTESVNPVRKDKVFKVPMMSAAAWKGLLRWTLMHIRLAQPVIASEAKQSPEKFAQERFVQTLLFGDEQGEEPGGVKGFAKYVDALKPESRAEYERLLRAYYNVESKDPLPHHSGRLVFYPTFFDAIDVEVINPHSRQTKAGTHPIYLECLPQGAQGTFSLLYVPFDLIGKDEATIRKQAAEDLQRVAEGLQAMFLTYGFSAKRTSGYGVAQEKVSDGFFQIRIEEASPLSPAAPSPAESQLPKYLQAPGKLKDEYLTPEGTFRVRSQAELAKMTKVQRQEYEKAQKWWEREGKDLSAQLPAPPQPPPKTAPQWLKREFDSFQQLCEQANQVAQMLQTGGDA